VQPRYRIEERNETRLGIFDLVLGEEENSGVGTFGAKGGC